MNRGSGLSPRTHQEYVQTASNEQPVDIFGSARNSGKPQSDKYAPQTRSDNVFSLYKGVMGISII